MAAISKTRGLLQLDGVDTMRLSVIVPVYNECSTIGSVIERLESVMPSDSELIVVDDGSTDGTTDILRQYTTGTAKIIFKNQNEGKTSAVRTGLAVARGHWAIVQDADLEYDPVDILRLVACAGSQGGAVYGRRPSLWNTPSRWHFALGVLVIDIALLLVYRRWVRDHATCYKLVPRQTLADFDLQSNGFEGCVEITAKLMRSNIPIAQAPIEYRPRSATAGKKLTSAYGWVALWAVWKFRNWTPVAASSSAQEPEKSQGVAAAVAPILCAPAQAEHAVPQQPVNAAS